jgi:hypothetical protein
LAAISALATLGAVTGDVSGLATLVAFLSARTLHAAGGSTLLGALTADVTGATAAVAGLLGLRGGALAAQMALLAAVVASRVALGGALGSAVRVVSACERN